MKGIFLNDNQKAALKKILTRTVDFVMDVSINISDKDDEYYELFIKTDKDLHPSNIFVVAREIAPKTRLIGLDMYVNGGVKYNDGYGIICSFEKTIKDPEY